MNLTTEQIQRVFALYFGTKRQGSQLLLKPLSALTDEDAIEVAKICTGIKENDKWNVCVPNSNYWRYVELKGSSIEVRIFFKQMHIVVCNVYGNSVSNSDNPNANLAFQYLIQQGYAVPIYVSPGHLDNGKTAIELNLALDVTTLRHQATRLR